MKIPRAVRAAGMISLIWGAGWAAVGFAIELVHNVWPNPLGALVDIWPAALGFPAFGAGLAFSTMLAVVGRRRKLTNLSLPAFTALGAAGGVLVSLFPAALVMVGLASLKHPYTIWQVTAPMIVPLAVLGAASAAASLILARKAQAGSLEENVGADDRRLVETPTPQLSERTAHGVPAARPDRVAASARRDT